MSNAKLKVEVGYMSNTHAGSTYRPATTAEIMEAYYDIRNAESPVIWMPKVEIEQDVDDGLYWLRVNDSPFIYFTNKEQAERMKNLLIEQLISYKAEP